MGGQRQDQRGDVAAEQAIEAPADAVIVERRQLTVAEPVRYRVVSRRPLAHAVEWLAREQHVLEQEADTGRRSDPAASIRTGKEGAEELIKAHPLEDSIDDRQGADPARVECPALGVSDLAGAGSGGGTGDMVLLGLFHLCCS